MFGAYKSRQENAKARSDSRRQKAKGAACAVLVSGYSLTVCSSDHLVNTMHNSCPRLLCQGLFCGVSLMFLRESLPSFWAVAVQQDLKLIIPGWRAGTMSAMMHHSNTASCMHCAHNSCTPATSDDIQQRCTTAAQSLVKVPSQNCQ